MTTIEDDHRLRAKRAINAARRGHLPKPKFIAPSSSSISSSTSSDLASSTNEPITTKPFSNIFDHATENSIEVYDDNFVRNSILTRSARMRKFKFYQYKPFVTPDPPPTKLNQAPQANTSQAPILIPRDDVLDGRIALITEQSSKELSELDDEIEKLEKTITELKNPTSNNKGSDNDKDNSKFIGNLEQIYELVNKKNDLLRRQMQLNILEQEKKLEKANEELTKELRQLMSIDDSKKTKAEIERQQHLYEQSLALVNKRNELVFHLDLQERAIEDDNFLKVQLKSVINKQTNGNSSSSSRRFKEREENCCIQ